MTLGLLGMHRLGWMEGVAQTAGGALAAAIWQGIAIALAVALGMRLLPRMPAAARFAIWISTFSAIALLPLVHWLTGNPSTAFINAAVERTPAVWTLDERWSVALVALWAAISLARTTSLAVGAVKLHGLWKRATPVEVNLPVSAVRKVQVCTSDEVERPGVIGFFAPKIVVPTWLFEKLTAPEIEQIVLHETGHLRRADDWVNLLQKLALAAFPLNPALLWVERKLCFERELACDDAVLRLTRSPKEYATCLTRIAEHRMGRRQPLGALSLGAVGRQSELGRRIESILRRGDWMSVGQARFAMAVAVAGLLGGTAELSRCRELVSFTGAPVAVAQGDVSALAVPGRMAEDSAYRPVASHPDEAARETLLKATVTARLAPVAQRARARTKVLLADRMKDPLPRLAAANGESDAVTDVPDNRNSHTAAQAWVVVTAIWSGAEGSRVVLTTEEMPAGSSRTTNSGAPDASAPAVLPAQVYPYAAVPIRDGWLVFQL